MVFLHAAFLPGTVGVTVKYLCAQLSVLTVLNPVDIAGLAQQVVCNDLRTLSIVTELDIPASLGSLLRAAVTAVRSLGKARAVARLVVRAAGRMAGFGAVGTACAAAISGAQVYHCADIHAGAECGVAGAGLDLVAVADNFAGDGGIALVQTLGNLVERIIVFQFLLDNKTVIIGQMLVFHNGYLYIKAAAL